MIAKSKVVFVSYTVVVIVFFSFVGIYLSGDKPSVVPPFIELVGLPGVFVAVFCLTGVHSDHFVLASILANIGVYLLVPYLVWRLFSRWMRRHPNNL
jgi:hypothetical protein